MPINCDTCQHWQAKSAGARAEQFSIGECRIGPPVRDFTWIRTKANDTCAQHSSKPQFATAKAPRAKKSNELPL